MKKTTRLPKHMGTGIYVHQQFSPRELVKGDTFNDADFGDMVWNGRKWIHQDEWDNKIWSNIDKEYKRYQKKTGRHSFFDYLKNFYYPAKRKYFPPNKQ